MCTVRETVVLVFPEAEICFPGFPGFSSRRLILGANYWSKIRNNWFFDYMHNFFLLITPVYGYCSVAAYTVIILLQITLFSFHRWVESLSVFAVTTQFIWVSSVISFFKFLKKASLKEVTATQKVINSGIFRFEVLIKKLSKKLTPHRMKIRASKSGMLHFFYIIHIYLVFSAAFIS